jgi:hypothetical protein
MLGIGCPFTRTVPMVDHDAAQRPLIHLSSPSTVLKKEKKTPYPFRSLLSTTWPCVCHSVRPAPNADATLPRCCHAPHSAPLAHPRSRALLAPSCRARSAHRARHSLGRAKTNAGGVGGRATSASAPARRAKPAAGGGGARAPLLATDSPSRWLDRPRPYPPLCCICMFQLLQTFHMYVAIVPF